MNPTFTNLTLFIGLLLAFAISECTWAGNVNEDKLPSLLAKIAIAQKAVVELGKKGEEERGAVSKLRELRMEHEVLLADRDQVLRRLAKDSNIRFAFKESLTEQLGQIDRQDARVAFEVDRLQQMARQLAGDEREKAVADLENASRSRDQISILRVLTQRIGLPKNILESSRNGRSLVEEERFRVEDINRLESQIKEAKKQNQRDQIDDLTSQLKNHQRQLKKLADRKIQFIKDQKK